MTDFPALNNEPVTERHARICREQGHATHTVDGVDTGVCPRCGDVTEAPLQAGEEVRVPLYSQTRVGGVLRKTGSRYRATVEALETRDGVPGVLLGRSTFHVGGGRKWLPLTDVGRY